MINGLISGAAIRDPPQSGDPTPPSASRRARSNNTIDPIALIPHSWRGTVAETIVRPDFEDMDFVVG